MNPGNKLYEDINFVEDNFGGTLHLEIVIQTNSQLKNSIIEPNSQFYNKINHFSNQLFKNSHIKTVTGYWDLEGNLNRNANLHIYRNPNRNRN